MQSRLRLRFADRVSPSIVKPQNSTGLINSRGPPGQRIDDSELIRAHDRLALPRSRNVGETDDAISCHLELTPDAHKHL